MVATCKIYYCYPNYCRETLLSYRQSFYKSMNHCQNRVLRLSTSETMYFIPVSHEPLNGIGLTNNPHATEFFFIFLANITWPHLVEHQLRMSVQYDCGTIHCMLLR